ncbi:hypothetical protein [Microcystis aeruginosa]|uniref:hypothetical protein n=1 Tax=Microcystis aeruginosa TaxID=1126 RepID=UPI003B5296CC
MEPESLLQKPSYPSEHLYSLHNWDAPKAQFGGRRWRKLKGVGLVQFPNGEIRKAELHWYESHGIGRRKMKVKRVLD